MSWRRRYHPRPPWWPQTEPWPPSDRRARWRRNRTRFVIRIALVFGALLFLSALGLNAVATLLFGGRAISQTLGSLAVIILFVLLFAGLFAVLMRRVGRPLGDVVEAANRVASGDFTVRVREHGPRSLRTVGRAFNTMAAKLESHDQQRRQLMADIAHELRTPLSVIQGRIEGILDGVYQRDDAQLSQVLMETRTLARLVDDLRTLARAESGTLTLQKEPTDLVILTQEAVDTFAAEAKSGQVCVRFDAPPDFPQIWVDPLRVREVLINLLSNALHHTPANGSITIALSAASDRIMLEVADTGTGIAVGDLPKVFDRFYKGAASRGSGLGLAIARNLITAHGGDITAGSRPGHGTTITISLPRGE
jgi:signal transduction histidine kinase